VGPRDCEQAATPRTQTLSVIGALLAAIRVARGPSLAESAGNGEQEATPQTQTLSVIAARVAAIHVDPRDEPRVTGLGEAAEIKQNNNVICSYCTWR
jgi:uncharacterized Zn-finger protein